MLRPSCCTLLVVLVMLRLSCGTRNVVSVTLRPLCQSLIEGGCWGAPSQVCASLRQCYMLRGLLLSRKIPAGRTGLNGGALAIRCNRTPQASGALLHAPNPLQQ